MENRNFDFGKVIKVLSDKDLSDLHQLILEEEANRLQKSLSKCFASLIGEIPAREKKNAKHDTFDLRELLDNNRSNNESVITYIIEKLNNLESRIDVVASLSGMPPKFNNPSMT